MASTLIAYDPATENRVNQATYDTINLMVLLIGDQTFQKMFSEPFSELFGRLRERVGTAAESRLMEHPNRVKERFRYLECAGGLTFVEAVRGSYAAHEGVHDTLRRLMREDGIHFPFLTGEERHDFAARKALDGLLNSAAGSQTYRDVYETRISDDRKVLDAVEAAMRADVIY